MHRIPCLIHGTLKGEGVVWGIYFFAQLGNIIIEYVLKYNFKAYSSISKIVTYFHAYVWKTKVRVLWTFISIKNLPLKT